MEGSDAGSRLPLRKGDGMLAMGTAPALVVALSLVLAACDGSAGDGVAATPAPAQATPGTPRADPAPAESASAAAAPGERAGIVEHLREKTMQVWEVYNTHDPDALKAFYEEGYWEAQEEEVRSNMEPFRAFGISINAEETSPPTEIAPGTWEVRHTGRFPLGSVKMIFIWEEFEGEWLLTYAESQ